MNYYITKLNNHAFSSTAQQGQHSVAKLARTMGFSDLSFDAYPTDQDSEVELERRIQGILAGTSHGDVFVFQYPTWLGHRFDRALYNALRAVPKGRVVVFVHDVVPLMFKGNYYLMADTLAMFNEADAVILPSDSMHRRLRLEGLSQDHVVIQEMWDGLSDYTRTQPM